MPTTGCRRRRSPSGSTIRDGWLRGRLDDAVSEYDSFRRSYPQLFERLVVVRNRAWAERIKVMLTRGETAFLLVGGGHLVGDVGVPALLASEDMHVITAEAQA